MKLFSFGEFVNESKSNNIESKLKSLATDDYQKRSSSGSYVRSGIPDSIEHFQNGLGFVFKGTNPRIAKEWVKKFLKSKDLNFKDMESFQEDDEITVEVNF